MQDFAHRRARGGAFVVTVALGLVANASSAYASEQTKYPLTLQNCGASVTFDKAPQRAVAIGQNSTEILLSLGLADKIVGTAVWVGPVLPQFEKENEKIKRLADNSPSFESVVAQEPDLVAAQFEWDVGQQGQAGTREQFSDLGIPTYISPADCVAKDNSGGGDGVRKEPFTMALVYQEIRELAEIFNVPDRGEKLVSDLKRREAEAITSIAGDKATGLPVVFWFSSKDVKGDAFVAGKNGAPAYMLRALGAKNIIDTDEEWPLVSWETIAAKDPAVIVVAEMTRRRYAADDPAVKVKFLETDPVTSQLDAVKERHFVMMDAQAMNPTIRTIDGIEALANGIRAFGLAK
ncbi:ABC transporter substrate-binding protein [Phyllobacterium leguminum]|uniref:Iron complex transport system substrate-binding protein n=1 Tax=Phyllobacterium leguminum TaxID=314237 RepID=A0A318T8S1_9HYPH|nr:ABC transporter substrate-binding protein [Phyllobacterium leguminum]PYE87050.1 iron complex transport system substrate-binding protein [Phyllobacterium leguminum]